MDFYNLHYGERWFDLTPVFDSKRVGDFVASKIKYMKGGYKDYEAIGLEKGGDLIAGVVYTDYNESDGDLQLHIAATTPRWCTKNTIRMFLDYPFNQLDCVRVTCLCAADNLRIATFLDGIGFTREGVLRKAFGRKVDAIIFGMLKEDCYWLDKDFKHGQVNAICTSSS